MASSGGLAPTWKRPRGQDQPRDTCRKSGWGGTWRDGGSGPLLCPACSASICGGPSHPQSRPGRHPSDSVTRGRLESRCTCEVPTSWGLCRGPCCRDRQPIIIAGGPSCQPGPGGFQSLEGRGPVSTLNSRPPRGPFPSPGLTPSLHSACAALGLDGQSPCSRAMCVPMARVYPPNSGREVHVHVHLELRRLPIASSPLRAARSPPTPRGSGSRTCASASPARQVTQVARKPRMIGRPAGAPYALHPFALQVAAGAPLWRPEASVRRWSRITLPARTGDRERQMCIKKNSFTN